MSSEETVTRHQQISGQSWKSGRSGGGEEEGREEAAAAACLDDMPAALCTGRSMTTAFMDAARIPQCFSVLPDNNACGDQASIRSAP